MSPKHMIMDYGRVWISTHVGVCMPVRLCVQLCVHTRATCLSPCMIAFKRAFAALRDEQSISAGDEHEGVCILRSYCPHAHPQPHSASILLTCVFPNSEIYACSPRKPANITADCLPS